MDRDNGMVNAGGLEVDGSIGGITSDGKNK